MDDRIKTIKRILKKKEHVFNEDFKKHVGGSYGIVGENLLAGFHPKINHVTYSFPNKEEYKEYSLQNIFTNIKEEAVQSVAKDLSVSNKFIYEESLADSCSAFIWNLNKGLIKRPLTALFKTYFAKILYYKTADSLIKNNPEYAKVKRKMRNVFYPFFKKEYNCSDDEVKKLYKKTFDRFWKEKGSMEFEAPEESFYYFFKNGVDILKSEPSNKGILAFDKKNIPENGITVDEYADFFEKFYQGDFSIKKVPFNAEIMGEEKIIEEEKSSSIRFRLMKELIIEILGEKAWLAFYWKEVLGKFKSEIEDELEIKSEAALKRFLVRNKSRIKKLFKIDELFKKQSALNLTIPFDTLSKRQQFIIDNRLKDKVQLSVLKIEEGEELTIDLINAKLKQPSKFTSLQDFLAHYSFEEPHHFILLGDSDGSLKKIIKSKYHKAIFSEEELKKYEQLIDKLENKILKYIKDFSKDDGIEYYLNENWVEKKKIESKN